MNPLQEQFERSVGDDFIEWLNRETGSSYVFLRRADRAPDLVYGWRSTELQIEVTAAYYDKDHAEFLWGGARGRKDAPGGWTGVEPDKSLATAVAQRVTGKSTKRYGNNAVLLINVPPGVTSAEELEQLLQSQTVPDDPFAGIYVVGHFPITSRSAGGYRVLPLKELARAPVG